MGGAEVQIKYLVHFLLEKKVQVHYIYEDKGNEFDNANNKNLILHPLSRIKISKRFGNRWFLYKYGINHLLNQIQPDGIYTRFYSSWSGFASLYAERVNIPHIWAIASDNDLKILDKPLNLLKPLDVIENYYVKKAFNKASQIIVQNTWQDLKLYQVYNRKGVCLKQAAPPLEKHIPAKDKNTLTIVWIANMKPLKRPELFIELASRFRGTKSILFKMIGRQDLKYKYLIKEEEKENPSFQYLGELSNNEVNDLLLSTDILVNTSDYEGFSNTFIQAWMRKNIVISMNSNPDDILHRYKVGFLSPTINQITERILFLKDNKLLLSEMQETSFNYANEEHNLDVNLNIIKDLLKIK